jgi:hypothetical protein
MNKGQTVMRSSTQNNTVFPTNGAPVRDTLRDTQHLLETWYSLMQLENQ